MINEIIKKNAVKYGIISALFGVFATTFMYVIDINLFVNIGLGFGILGVYLLIGIILLSATKKEMQNKFSYKEAFTTYFLSALIGITISTAFSLLLFNVIDTEARDLVSEIFIKNQIKMFEGFGMPPSQIKETVEELEKNSQFSVKGLFFGFLQSLLGSIIFGLILAAFFKSKSTQE